VSFLQENFQLTPFFECALSKTKAIVCLAMDTLEEWLKIWVDFLKRSSR
jgi:hypothetical protein